VQDGHVCLDRGPRVNGHRPAVDALFRSAAMEYGPACCGVVLSGSRDDGAAGLADIKAHGGAAIVQDPHEAQYDGMPANALAGTTVDYMLPATEIAEVLVRLAVRGRVPGPVQKAEENSARPPEMLSVLCPECGGTLFQDDQGGFVQFHCHVGHRFAARSLLAAHAEGVERAMWTAMRSLEDRATLLRRMAAGMSERGAITAASLEAQAASADEQARAIRDAIAALDDSEIGSVPDDEETLP
jgi:two-component system chemotaxis response regulator CheB